MENNYDPETIRKKVLPKKDKTFIQKINIKVMEIYDELQKVSNITKDARLSVLKSMKVRPIALIRTLQDYLEDCKCKELKSQLNGIIYSIQAMLPGGETRLFECHSKKNLKTNLEFICVAVRMYKYENEKVCDFCVSTYSYAKSIDSAGLTAGLGTLTSGVAFGAFAALGILTGGVGPVILGSISAILGGASLIGGTAITAASLNTELEENMGDILEASFLYELVSRGHAVLQHGNLFIKHSDDYSEDE